MNFGNSRNRADVRLRISVILLRSCRMTHEELCRCARYGNSMEFSGLSLMLKDIVGVVINDF